MNCCDMPQISVSISVVEPLKCDLDFDVTCTVVMMNWDIANTTEDLLTHV